MEVRRGQLGEGRQQDARPAEPVDGAVVGFVVDDIAAPAPSDVISDPPACAHGNPSCRVRGAAVEQREDPLGGHRQPVGRTPIASWIALAMAAATFPIGGSPIPRAPSGPLPSPLSTMPTSTSGKSCAFGIR